MSTSSSTSANEPTNYPNAPLSRSRGRGAGGESCLVAVGSANPVKVAAAERAVADLLPGARVEAVNVRSGVPEQPWGDEQTAGGALARAVAARAALGADYGIGIESGLSEGPGGRIYVTSWAAAIGPDGATGFGSSERFALPEAIGRRLRVGGELGPVIDDAFGQTGLARRMGAVGALTQGRRDRTDILAVAALHALIALLEPWRATQE